MSDRPVLRIDVDPRWRVRCACEVELPLNAVAVWQQMRDVVGFCRMDPLHRRVRIQLDDDGDGIGVVPYPPRGANLLSCHR